MILPDQATNKRRFFYLSSSLFLLPWLIMFADLCGFFVSQHLAHWLIYQRVFSSLDPLWFLVFILAAINLYLFNTYHPELETSPINYLARIILAGFVIVVLFIILIGIIGIGNPNRLYWQQEPRLFLSIFILTAWSAIIRLWLSWRLGKISRLGKWNIICHNDKINEISRFFRERHPHAQVTFFTNDLDQLPPWSHSQYPVEEISNTLDTYNLQFCSGILVDHHVQLSDQQLSDLMLLRLQGTHIYNLPDFFENFLMKVPPISLRDHWFIFKTGFVLLHNPAYLRVKRLADICISGSLIILLSPLMILTMLAIRLDSPGPIFYSQTRTGLNQKPFKVLKFRSMYQDAEARGAQWATERDPRITRVGRLIRATRIDELPQFLNVLLGTMSMIGPRPERPEFDQKLAEHIPYYSVRYSIRPGITGWAQVMYPYGASIEDAYEKFSYDLYYLKNYSVILDLRIVLKTVRVVLFGKGR